MGMDITGLEEMIFKAKGLTEGTDRHARSAVREGAKLTADKLQSNTPVSDEDHSGKGPLKSHVKTTGVSIKSGNYESKVGYDNEKGRIAHFPNSGTSKQDPQHFIEETLDESKDEVLKIFETELRKQFGLD